MAPESVVIGLPEGDVQWGSTVSGAKKRQVRQSQGMTSFTGVSSSAGAAANFGLGAIAGGTGIGVLNIGRA